MKEVHLSVHCHRTVVWWSHSPPWVWLHVACDDLNIMAHATTACGCDVTQGRGQNHKWLPLWILNNLLLVLASNIFSCTVFVLRAHYHAIKLLLNSNRYSGVITYSGAPLIWPPLCHENLVIITGRLDYNKVVKQGNGWTFNLSRAQKSGHDNDVVIRWVSTVLIWLILDMKSTGSVLVKPAPSV